VRSPVRKCLSVLCCLLMLALAIHVVMADVRADSSGIADADLAGDAGDSLVEASPIVPGNHTGYLDPSVDTDDYYAIGLLAGETLSLFLNVPSVLNYDLQLYDPTDTLASSSTNGIGSDESIVHSIGSDGIWKVRVHHVSGSGDGSYNLNIILSAGYEKFVLDVGAADDNQSASHLPGISIFDSVEWADPVSGARIASTNASFFLNIYEGTYQENTYYELSIRYSCTEDVNVSVFMNGIWVHVATLPGMSTYWKYTFLLEPSYLTDYSDLLLGMNVRLRFDDTVTVDSINAVSVAWDSDFFGDIECNPGVMMENGWTMDGTVINGSANAAMIVNIPSVESSYFLELSILAECSGIAVQQWDGASWIALGTLEAWGTVAVIQLNENEYYDVSSDAGMNIRIRFTSSVVNLSKVTLWTSQRTTDVGISGDMDTHPVPGISISDNDEWSSMTTSGGRTIRNTVAGMNADFYLNGAISGMSYIITIAYNTSSPASIRQCTGDGTFSTICNLNGNGWWNVISFKTINTDMYDGNTDYDGLTICFEIVASSTVAVDNMVVCMDQDNDGIPDAQEAIRVTMSSIGTFTYALNPFSADTDSDGLDDGVEIDSYGTDPTDPDTDDDGLEDGSERFSYIYDSDSLLSIPDGGQRTVTVYLPSIPYHVQSICLLVGLMHPDQSQIRIKTYLISSLFATTVRSSGVGAGANLFLCIDLLDFYSRSDFYLGWDMHVIISDVSGDGNYGRIEYVKVQVNATTDPLDSDSDNDGLSDGEEVNFGEYGWYTNPRDSDSDNDGISDLNEILGNTPCGHILDPSKADTDDDGTYDANDLWFGDAVLRVVIEEYKSLELISLGSNRNIFFGVEVNDRSFCTKRLAAQKGTLYSPGWAYDIDVPEDSTYALVRITAIADDAGWLGDDIKLDLDPSAGSDRMTLYLNQTLSVQKTYHPTQGSNQLFDNDADAYLNASLQVVIADKSDVIIINGTGDSGDYGLDANATGAYRYSADDRVFMFNLNVTGSSSNFSSGGTTIIVPRSIALQCAMNQSLCNLSGGVPADLQGASFYYGNYGSASAHVIAVFFQNVTAQAAERILHNLTHDPQGSRIGNHVAVDDEDVYLLHLPYHVVSAIPTYIENAGLGAGTNYLGSAVTIITDMVFEFLALEATSVIYIVHHIVELGLGFLGGLSTAIADAVQGAIDAVVESLSILVDFIIQTVLSICSGFMESVLLPLSQMWMGYCQGIAYAMSLMVADYESLGYVTIDSMQALAQAFQGDFFWLAFGLAAIITAVVIALTATASVASFLFAIAMTVVTTVIIQSVFSHDGAESNPTVDYTTFMVMDPNDMEGSLLIAEELGIAPDGDDNSTEARDWRSVFAITSMAVGIFAAQIAVAGLYEAGVSAFMFKLGVAGVVAALIASALSFMGVFNTGGDMGLIFTGFWLSLFSIGTSVYPLVSGQSNAFTKGVCITSLIIGGISLLLSIGAASYDHN